ncbi:MAG: hypothetical protein ACXU8S_00885 [Phenylobacterium sp.]
MDFLKDRGIALALGGAAVALVAGLAIAWALVAQHRGEASPPPPASRGGLVIDAAGTTEGHINPSKPLRCFVAGQSVGEMTIADCARRNGVSTDALDVGLDQSGALAAGGQAGTAITPLPPTDAKPVVEAAPETAPPPNAGPQVAGGPADACWRYAAGQWRKLTPDLPLGACAQTLFGGRCVRQGDAAYGRWGQQTLRLVPGRVETSADNRNFRALMDQPGCPALG